MPETQTHTRGHQYTHTHKRAVTNWGCQRAPSTPGTSACRRCTLQGLGGSVCVCVCKTAGCVIYSSASPCRREATSPRSCKHTGTRVLGEPQPAGITSGSSPRHNNDDHNNDNSGRTTAHRHTRARIRASGKRGRGDKWKRETRQHPPPGPRRDKKRRRRDRRGLRRWSRRAFKKKRRRRMKICLYLREQKGRPA